MAKDGPSWVSIIQKLQFCEISLCLYTQIAFSQISACPNQISANKKACDSLDQLQFFELRYKGGNGGI